jgi:hypothetical protein
MNTEQLQRVIQCDGYMKSRILGVFSADDLPAHLTPGTGLIVNTDPANLPGRHWVAFYLNEQNELECFDSFGKPPSTYSIYLKQFMSRFSKLVMSDIHLQSRNSNVCGQYCLLYLMCRCRGLSVHYFYHMFCSRASINDEFVYNLIKRDFECCLYNCNNGQCSVSEK